MAVQASGKNNATGDKTQQPFGNVTRSTKINPTMRVNLDPSNQMVLTKMTGTLYLFTYRYKRMRSSSTPSPEKEVSTRNRFANLRVDEKSDAQPTKINKPPPIMLYGIKNVAKLKEIIDGVLEKSQYSFKNVTKNLLRLTMDSSDTYKSLMV